MGAPATPIAARPSGHLTGFSPLTRFLREHPSAPSPSVRAGVADEAARDVDRYVGPCLNADMGSFPSGSLPASIANHQAHCVIPTVNKLEER